jgi:hypothetical protein
MMLPKALAFIAVSHPATYRTTRGLLGSWVATQEGLPKTGGLILHAIVFLLVLRLFWMLMRRASYAHIEGKGMMPSAYGHPAGSK